MTPFDSARKFLRWLFLEKPADWGVALVLLAYLLFLLRLL